MAFQIAYQYVKKYINQTDERIALTRLKKSVLVAARKIDEVPCKPVIVVEAE